MEYLKPLDVEIVHSRGCLEERLSLRYEGCGVPRLGCVDLEYALGELSNPELRVLTILQYQLIYHNYLILDTSKLKYRLEWGDRMMRRVMKSVEGKRLIKIFDNEMENKRERLVAIHPFMGWVGHSPARESALKRWCV